MKRSQLFILVVLSSVFACRTNKPETKVPNLPDSTLSQTILTPSAEQIQLKDREKNEPQYSYRRAELASVAGRAKYDAETIMSKCMVAPAPATFHTEEYDDINENIFHDVTKAPLSTFSIDVDAASYANMRRFVNSNQLPPKDAVRIEEFINYFPYNYPEPKNSDPVSITAEMADCPWAPQHRLVRIGLKGREIKTEGLPPSNLVFLIDVSGSMQVENKLPLLKSAFRLLVNQLRPKDKVSIVVYAGNAGLVLPATPGDHKDEILGAIDRLEAGGSTAGGAGILLAYETAKKSFLKNGNNRVILATDGDFNVGTSSDGELVRLIEEKRQEGVFLTVLGFGMGNYKDSKMEKLADKGNGNYAYIDNLLEAKKVFVNEMGATLYTIAKDVKIQVEFNPAKVQAYRLIGYENRLLRDEDFNDDKKDAGEMGAGGTVTALYDVIPVGVNENIGSIDPLKYQTAAIKPQASDSPEWLTVKFRYKEPKGSTSKMVAMALTGPGTELENSADDFRFAAAVAGFGMLLRGSDYKNDLAYADVIALAKNAMGEDPEGYRAEFLKIVKTCQAIASTQEAAVR